MIVTNGLDISGRDSFGRREDLSFIVRFHWKTSDHLKEAIQVLLSSRLAAIVETGEVCKPCSRRRSDNINESDCEQIRMHIASNPNTPPVVLEYLANQVGPQILERIAEHPKAPSSLLAQLSKNPNPSVRAAVGENRNTSEDVLARLLVDNDADVRYRLAENPLLPIRVLLQLTEDSNPYVAARAAVTISRASGGRVLSADFGERGSRLEQGQQAQGY